jgi:hypothetical protein
MLTSFTTVVARLAIFSVIYEITSAVLTSVRSIQALNHGGPWRMQQKSLTFLVLREGARYHILDFLRVRVLILNCFAAGLIYFGWDSSERLRGMLY